MVLRREIIPPDSIKTIILERGVSALRVRHDSQRTRARALVWRLRNIMRGAWIKLDKGGQVVL